MQFLKDRDGYFFTNRALVKLILPLIIEQLLAVLVGMADSIMVASVGEAAVSGVSLVDTIFILLINVFAALATGGAVISGHFLGKKKEKDACGAADQLVLFTTVFSIAVMALVYLCRPFILNVVFGKIEADVAYNANLYLLIVTASIPMISLYNAGAAIFRMMGDSRTAMFMSLFMNGINIAGNALLLYGLKWGVEGAAIPTLVSRVVAGVVMIALLFDKKKVLHLSWPMQLKFDWPVLKQILHIGIPNGLENSMFQLGKILVLSMVSAFGTASIAANAVSNTLAMFQILPGMAIGLGMLTVTAQCVGANQYDQVKYYTKKLLAAAHVLMLFSAGLILLLLPVILNVYHLSNEATEMVRLIIIYHGICCVAIWPEAFTLPYTLRAAKDVRYCMWISIISMWVCRIGCSWVLGEYLGLGLFGVWVAMTLDWVVRVVFFVIRYSRGKWQYQK